MNEKKVFYIKNFPVKSALVLAIAWTTCFIGITLYGYFVAWRMGEYGWALLLWIFYFALLLYATYASTYRIYLLDDRLLEKQILRKPRELLLKDITQIAGRNYKSPSPVLLQYTILKTALGPIAPPQDFVIVSTIYKKFPRYPMEHSLVIALREKLPDLPVDEEYLKVQKFQENLYRAKSFRVLFALGIFMIILALVVVIYFA